MKGQSQFLPILIIVAFFAFLYIGPLQGSLVNDFNSLEYANCQYNEQSDITGCEMYNPDLDELSYYGFTREDADFRVLIRNTDMGEQHKPFAAWLNNNGYKTTDEPFRDTDVGSGDYNYTSEVKQHLEENTEVELTIDVSSPGLVAVITDQTEQDYNDDPEPYGGGDQPENYFNVEGERHARHIMEPTTVTTDDISIKDGRIYATFNMSKIIDKGMELPGKFKKWDGRYATVDETGASASVSVDFPEHRHDYVEPIEDPVDQPDSGSGDDSEDGVQSPPVEDESFIDSLLSGFFSIFEVFGL